MIQHEQAVAEPFLPGRPGHRQSHQCIAQLIRRLAQKFKPGLLTDFLGNIFFHDQHADHAAGVVAQRNHRLGDRHALLADAAHIADHLAGGKGLVDRRLPCRVRNLPDHAVAVQRMLLGPGPGQHNRIDAVVGRRVDENVRFIQLRNKRQLRFHLFQQINIRIGQIRILQT